MRKVLCGLICVFVASIFGCVNDTTPIPTAPDLTVPTASEKPLSWAQWAYSGTYEWYSGKGNNLDNTLTQEFPMSLTGSYLRFWTWYDIEPGVDFGFVEISTDGGFTWGHQTGNITTGVPGIGPAITGNSGGWVQAIFDLSHFDGQTVLLRFRYETNKTIQHHGWAIDDFDMSNGFYDDVEAGEGGWMADGWQVVIGIYDDQQAVDDLIDDTEDLINADGLTSGQGGSLLSKLQNIKKKLEDGKITAAINQLAAFINQVNSFVNDGVMTSAEGQALIDAANGMITALSG